eukprot:4867088-Lingulodinium_polyedra.AAC.1
MHTPTPAPPHSRRSTRACRSPRAAGGGKASRGAGTPQKDADNPTAGAGAGGRFGQTDGWINN